MDAGLTGTPVKLMLDRKEEHLDSGNRPSAFSKIRAVASGRAAAWRLEATAPELLLSLRTGARGLAHTSGTYYGGLLAGAAPGHGLVLPDRELACAPIASELGQRYLGAMRAAINCALANRQILTHLCREAFGRVLPGFNAIRNNNEAYDDEGHGTHMAGVAAAAGRTTAPNARR